MKRGKPKPGLATRKDREERERREREIEAGRFFTEYNVPHAEQDAAQGGHIWKQDPNGSWRCLTCGARCWHPADVRMSCGEVVEDRAAPRPGPRRQQPKKEEEQ